MAQPTIVPAKWNNTYKDYLQTKCSRDGDANIQVSQVSVPSGTAINATVGIIPFNKGDRISVPATVIVSDALGTSVTASVGIIYNLDTQFTGNQTLFASGVAAPAAGGVVTLTPSATNVPYVMLGDGWLVVTITGAATTTTGNLTASVVMVYDGVNATN